MHRNKQFEGESTLIKHQKHHHYGGAVRRYSSMAMANLPITSIFGRGWPRVGSKVFFQSYHNVVLNNCQWYLKICLMWPFKLVTYCLFEKCSKRFLTILFIGVSFTYLKGPLNRIKSVDDDTFYFKVWLYVLWTLINVIIPQKKIFLILVYGVCR